MNDALRKAAASDPQWARRESRRRLILFVLAIGVLVSVAVGIPALVIGLHNGTEISVIQHSPCQVEPAGRECQDIKAESDEAASLHTSCIQFRKVDLNGKLLAETRCKGGDLPGNPVTAGSRSAAAHRAAPPTNGGDATSAPTGSSQPGRHQGGSGDGGEAGRPEHHHPAQVPGEPGGGEGVPSPPSSSTSTSSQSSSSSTTERVEPTVVESRPQEVGASGLGALGEGVGHTVEGVGTTADETVHGVGCGVTGALGAPCE